jgi:hypothetical protein
VRVVERSRLPRVAGHRAHHAAAFEEPHASDFGRTYPILHGKTGRALERLLDAVPVPALWTAAWAFLTLFDMFMFVGCATMATSILV